jgi:hypothetical protein
VRHRSILVCSVKMNFGGLGFLSPDNASRPALVLLLSRGSFGRVFRNPSFRVGEGSGSMLNPLVQN